MFELSPEGEKFVARLEWLGHSSQQCYIMCGENAAVTVQTLLKLERDLLFILPSDLRLGWSIDILDRCVGIFES